MAEKNDKDLIGFDPLAWMNESEVETTSEEAVVTSAQPSVSDTTETVSSESLSVQQATESVSESEAPNDEGGKLTLDATLNIQNVSHLYEQVLVLLEGQDKIEIDASSVIAIDTATLQLLIVLKQSAVKLGKEIVFDFPSDKFIDSAELLGLAEMLEIDQAAAGFF